MPPPIENVESKTTLPILNGAESIIIAIHRGDPLDAEAGTRIARSSTQQTPRPRNMGHVQHRVVSYLLLHPRHARTPWITITDNLPERARDDGRSLGECSGVCRDGFVGRIATETRGISYAE